MTQFPEAIEGPAQVQQLPLCVLEGAAQDRRRACQLALPRQRRPRPPHLCHFLAHRILRVARTRPRLFHREILIVAPSWPRSRILELSPERRVETRQRLSPRAPEADRPGARCRLPFQLSHGPPVTGAYATAPASPLCRASLLARRALSRRSCESASAAPRTLQPRQLHPLPTRARALSRSPCRLACLQLCDPARHDGTTVEDLTGITARTWSKDRLHDDSRPTDDDSLQSRRARRAHEIGTTVNDLDRPAATKPDRVGILPADALEDLRGLSDDVVRKVSERICGMTPMRRQPQCRREQDLELGRSRDFPVDADDHGQRRTWSPRAGRFVHTAISRMLHRLSEHPIRWLEPGEGFRSPACPS